MISRRCHDNSLSFNQHKQAIVSIYTATSRGGSINGGIWNCSQTSQDEPADKRRVEENYGGGGGGGRGLVFIQTSAFMGTLFLSSFSILPLLFALDSMSALFAIIAGQNLRRLEQSLMFIIGSLSNEQQNAMNYNYRGSDERGHQLCKLE